MRRSHTPHRTRELAVMLCAALLFGGCCPYQVKDTPVPVEATPAVAAVPVTDTVKLAGDDHFVQGTPPRENLWAVQTPQVFRFEIISEAYGKQNDEVTDDARLVEQLGYPVKLYMGSYRNIKITNPDDLALAGVLWQEHGS